MTAKASFHIIGYLFGLAAFASIYLALRPRLVAAGRDVHLQTLVPIHCFRYFGLTALLPGVFDLGQAGFSGGYLTQIAAGDVLAAILTLITFFLLRPGAAPSTASVWSFNGFGTLDYLNAGARVTPAIHDANVLGPFGWIVMTVLLPAWLVSHVAIFFALRQPR
jgi:hypothetical protein